MNQISKSLFIGVLNGGFWLNRADSGLLSYVLWCCGSVCNEILNFIQIGTKHTVCTALLYYCDISACYYLAY